MIRVALTVFAWLFFLDGVLSLGHASVLGTSRDVSVLVVLYSIVALLTFLAGLLLYGVCFFTPRMPKRIVVTATIFLLWAACMGFPLFLWTQGNTFFVVSIIQLLMGTAFLIYFHEHGTHWFSVLRNPAENRPKFTWKNFLLFVAANVVILPAFLVLWVVNLGVYSLQDSTAGFIQVRPSGIFIQERLFERDHHEVHLVGMMHMAERKFYDGLLAGLPPKEKSIVLLEGVSDRKHLMKGSDLGMRRLSRLLGIDAQSDSSFTERATAGLEAQKKGGDNDAIQYLRADRDISDFRPQTIACLKEVMALAASATLHELFTRLGNPDSPLTRAEDQKVMMEDILDGRNTFILSKIEESMPGYSHIIVPWGAMHMPYLQQKLLEKGFHEIQRTDHKAMAFF
ncbi:MAG: hypothetical protein ABI443_10155 [Chthoniobacterales bacterium]